MKYRAFKEKNYFHVNIEFNVHPLFKELDWIYIQKKIKSVSETNKIFVHALVMLDTHIHILISSNNKNENFFCEKFKIEVSGGRGADCFCEPILSYSQYLNTYKYIYRNPIEAAICSKAEDYPFSTLRIILGKAVGYIQIEDQLAVIQNPIKILNWINQDRNFKESQLMDLRQDNSRSM